MLTSEKGWLVELLVELHLTLNDHWWYFVIDCFNINTPGNPFETYISRNLVGPKKIHDSCSFILESKWELGRSLWKLQCDWIMGDNHAQGKTSFNFKTSLGIGWIVIVACIFIFSNGNMKSCLAQCYAICAPWWIIVELGKTSDVNYSKPFMTFRGK